MWGGEARGGPHPATALPPRRGPGPATALAPSWGSSGIKGGGCGVGRAGTEPERPGEGPGEGPGTHPVKSRSCSLQLETACLQQ